MRILATAGAAVLAMATGAAAASKFISTIDDWTDPANLVSNPFPQGEAWSYYPNSWGVTQDVCGNATLGQEPCGPLNWAKGPWLDPQSCNATLKQQTPVDLNINEDGYSRLGKSAGIMFNGYKCQADVEEKKGTWEVDFWHCYEKSTITVDGREWVFWQMHIHGPSEHTVDAFYYPLEIHLVHIPKGTDPFIFDKLPNEVLVLGVFVTVGKVNKVWDVFTHHQAEEVGHIYKAINPYDLVPKKKAYWNYKGSLTTPFGLKTDKGSFTLGCNVANGVNWYVFKNPIQMSAAQISWGTEYQNSKLKLPYLGQNNRPIQLILPSTKFASYGKPLN